MTRHEEKRKGRVRDEYKYLALTPTEVFFLESALSAIPAPQEKAEGLPTLRPFLLRLGSLFLEGQGGTLAVNEEEAWHLRDKIPLVAKMGAEPVGANLHRKLHVVLLGFDNDRRVELDSGIIDEPGKEGIVKLMKEVPDAGESSDADPKSDSYPGGDARSGPEVEP